MCKPASFVLTKEKAFWSKRDESHEAIIREFALHEGAGRINFVRVEISPPDNDFRVPRKQFSLNTCSTWARLFAAARIGNDLS